MTGGDEPSIRRQWWAWALAVLVIAVAVAPLVRHWLTNPDDQRLVDLDVYRTGGQMILEGRSVYEFFTPAPQLLPFTYPPIAAMLAALLAKLSWESAQWVWTVGVYVALGVAVAYSFRKVLGRHAPWVFAFLMVACAYLMPIRDQVRFGQVDILLVALCLADCVARRPWWPRGFLIGLATAVKLTPGVFLIYLMVTRQWRTFFMAAFTTALLTLLPFAVIPQDAADFWFSALLDPERLGANAATTNQSIRGMLIRLYLPDALTTALWLALVALVGWYGFRGAARAKDPVVAVGLVGLMAVLLSPVAWIHHLAWVVVVLGALVGDGRDPVRLRVATGVWLYYVLPIPWWGVALKAAEIPLVSPILGKIVQNAYGLGAVALVWLLASWLPARRAEAVTPRVTALS
ncbi:glycosyltransferase 87 family protein [Nonomuraea cavernae]|uniref:Membrane protein n=1 Tax=Nonomuraea cavernae TaxID=2045107 RepID=A0A917Z7Y9_9ACTN|nr:glycosyltransferase 87 family protein [Nonomuraea cavernae]MCA2189879.1 glycosyltransferase 87 family protein [Nonomuraea cavernae]GGO77765.1 membrane protein [Nonomuraea cavernae]